MSAGFFGFYRSKLKGFRRSPIHTGPRWNVTAPAATVILIVASLGGYLIDSWWRLIIPVIGAVLSTAFISKAFDWPAGYTSPTQLFFGTAAIRSRPPQKFSGTEAIIAAAHADILIPQGFSRKEQTFIDSLSKEQGERTAVQRGVEELVDNGTLIRNHDDNGRSVVQLSSQGQQAFESRWMPSTLAAARI